MSGFDLNPSSELDATHERVREAANAWLARFAPLVMTDLPVTEEELRTQVAVTEGLSAEAGDLSSRLESLGNLDDIELRQTFRRAAIQLESIETDLRKRLARLAPGDPEGIVDLAQLQERLNERAARQEMGLATTQEIPSVLAMKTAPGSPAAGAFLGLFGFGWSAFTLVHAILMIGGMAKAFGLIAFALLGFYAIFFAVGFGMLWTAFLLSSAEEVELDGHTLTVRRRLGPISRTKTFLVASKSRASIGVSETMMVNSRRGSKATPAILLTGDDGKPISFGFNATDESRQETVRRINAYLDAQPTRE